MATEVVSVIDRASVADELRRAGEVLRRGGLVAFPTETVYGIAVAATIPAAVDRLYQIKRRPRGKPMTLMVADVAEVRRRCRRIPPAAERLMERFWPGPLTLVLSDRDGLLTGFRLPNHPLARGLVREAGVPLLVPSANIADEPPAVTAEQVLAAFPDELDLVIDGGSAVGGVPSTVVRVTDEGVEVLREGAIPERHVVDASHVNVLFVCSGNTDRSPLAAALLRRRLAERMGCREADLSARGVTVESAGLHVESEGRPASDAVRRIAAEWPEGALDLESHRSTRLTEEMVRRATHVFCMERAHLEEILAFFPGRLRDVRLLDPEGNDVEDPAGRTPLAYRNLARRLDAAATLIAGGLSSCVSSS
jgi:tRNA threonylcarbamoyl adenosine modification protein (Sua5/YciO/YrdC/YwlC family)